MKLRGDGVVKYFGKKRKKKFAIGRSLLKLEGPKPFVFNMGVNAAVLTEKQLQTEGRSE